MNGGFPGLAGALAFGLVLSGWAHPLLGRQSELSVEVGGSAIRPPEGAEGDAARYVAGGLRATHASPGGSGLLMSLMAGRAFGDETGGDFLSGSLEGVLRRRFSRSWSWTGQVSTFGFQVGDPYPYRALGVEGSAALEFNSRRASAEVKAVAGSGWSRAELVRFARRMPGEVTDDLWRYGATAEVLAGSERVMAGLSGGLHESSGGTYRSGGIRVLADLGGPALELRVDAWQAPLGNEVTGGIAFHVPVGEWSLRGFLGRTEPDPLTLAEPGGGSGGLFLGRRILGTGPLPPVPPPLHEVIRASDGETTVRIHVRPPAGARTVQLLGDFTLWEPVSMEPDGELWTVDLEVPVGTYHFGFLVDDEWFLPENAPDAVSDDWGRRNATLVIEGSGP